MSLTQGIWSDCWSGKATRSAWRPPDGRRWPCLGSQVGSQALGIGSRVLGTIFRSLLTSTYCSWIFTCRNLTALKSSRRFGRGSGRRGGHLPVVAVTARSRKEDREHCLAVGMDEYLAKPIQAAELLAAIDRRVPPRAASSRPESVASLLSPAVLLAACGDHAETLHELLQDFRTYAPERLAEVVAALRARDAARLHDAAHKLVGLFSAFSTLAGQAASEVEGLAALGQFDQARPLVERLESMSPELFQQIDELSLDELRRQAGAAKR